LLGVQVDCDRPDPALFEERLHPRPSGRTLSAAVNQGDNGLDIHAHDYPLSHQVVLPVAPSAPDQGEIASFLVVRPLAGSVSPPAVG
jgi:hypothetical protein